MFADPKKVVGRRLRRRVKAGVAVALAVVAGTFLACKGASEPPGASPFGPDARTGPAPEPDVALDAADAADAADAPGPDAADAAPEASTALVVRDAAADARAKAPKVDKREHRKGMPVRDNLLE